MREDGRWMTALRAVVAVLIFAEAFVIVAAAADDAYWRPMVVLTACVFVAWLLARTFWSWSGPGKPSSASEGVD